MNWLRRIVGGIQNEIASAVAEGLRLPLLGEPLTSARTLPQVYAMYLKAGQLLNDRTAASTLEAKSLLIRALKMDAEYVPAWLHLARAYGLGGAVGAWHPEQSFPLQRSAAVEVQRLDPGNVEALVMLAGVATMYDYDFDAAQAYLERARAMDSDNEAIRNQEAALLMLTGQYDLAIPMQEQRVVEDPGNTNVRYQLAQWYLLARRFDDAKQSFRRSIELSPRSAGSRFYLGALHMLEGNFEKSRDIIEDETRDGYHATGRALWSYAQGRYDEADARLQELINLGYRWAYQIAAVHAYRDEADEAFKWLDRAIGRRDTSLGLIVGDLFIDAIRDDPRFDVILNRLGRKRR